MDNLLNFFQPYIVQVKFIHIIAVMIWLWSASIAYMWILRTAWNEWKYNPNKINRERRNWVFEQYDKGLEFEHIAMLVTFMSGFLLLKLSAIDPIQTKWMFYKLLIAFLVFLPLEIYDSWLAHFYGNKKRIREKHGEGEKYERAMQKNWNFLQIVSPPIVVFMLIALYLAIVKPVL